MLDPRPHLVLAFTASNNSATEPTVDALVARWACGHGAPRVTQVALPIDEPERALVERFVSAVRAADGAAGGAGTPLFVGGFSLGARIAALSVNRISPAGLIALGFPFHRRGTPQDRHGLEALADVSVPTLIVQGTRDPHGSREFVRGVSLNEPVHVHWLEDGNHRWRPRASAEITPDELLADAAQAVLAFIE